jgi:DNA-binding IclR family transcriptional regulator
VTIADLDLDEVVGAVEEREDAPLRSVSIAMGVLGCFEREAELGATRVAGELGIAKNTACRMLAALAASGMLERTSSGRYRLGLRLFEIGQLAVDRPMLREPRRARAGANCATCRARRPSSVPVGTEVLYVDRPEGSGVGTMFHTGCTRRGPGHSSSAPRRSRPTTRRWRARSWEKGFQRRTPFTIIDPRR